MYNVQTITTALRGLVGFRPHHDEALADIESDLTTSRSGLWLDKAHALITAQILTGAAVVLTPTEEDKPETPIVDIDPLSALIRSTLDDSVSAVLSALRTRKLLRLEGKTLLSSVPLFEGEGSINDLIQPAGRFVGLQITTNDINLAVALPRLSIQLTGHAPSFPIYVSSDGNAPAQVTTVSTTSMGRSQWFDTNIILAGATNYIVGYYESDLPSGVQAVRRNKPIGNVPCAGCSPQNAGLWAKWKPYVQIAGVRIDNPGGPIDTVENQNYGMSLALSIGCDIGPFLIAQQMNMAEAVQQQAVVKILSELAYSPLITTIEQQVRQNAMFALKNGEEAKLERLLDALDIDFSGLSARCLPDTTTIGLVRRTTVFRR